MADSVDEFPDVIVVGNALGVQTGVVQSDTTTTATVAVTADDCVHVFGAVPNVGVTPNDWVAGGVTTQVAPLQPAVP